MFASGEGKISSTFSLETSCAWRPDHVRNKVFSDSEFDYFEPLFGFEIHDSVTYILTHIFPYIKNRKKYIGLNFNFSLQCV